MAGFDYRQEEIETDNMIDAIQLTSVSNFIFTPQYKAVLEITPEFCIYQTRKPNLFVRFWQRVLLGWKWRDA